MLVKLLWPDGTIEEIEHEHAQHAVVIEIARVEARFLAPPVEGDADVMTSIQNYAVPVHRFRRILVGNVDTGNIHTLWVHADTDGRVVQRVVDALVVRETKG